MAPQLQFLDPPLPSAHTVARISRKLTETQVIITIIIIIIIFIRSQSERYEHDKLTGWTAEHTYK